MRNSTTMLIVGIIAALGFVVWLVVDPLAKDKVLAMVSVIITAVTIMSFGIVVGQKHSPAAIGYGFRTSLEKTDPVNTVDMTNPENPKEPIKLDIYPNNGCQPFWIRGGGKHGYTVFRRDLTINLSGDKVNIISKTAPPDFYMLDAPPESEYHDLRELPRKLYDALRQTDGWHDKAKVAVFWDPPGIDPLAEWDEKKGMPYQTLWHKVNRENIELQKQNLNLLKANTKYSKTHLTAARAYDKQIEGEDADPREVDE